MLNPRSLYDAVPPEARTRMQDHPTLLFTWWCTGFSFTIIALRLTGRYIRTERFFTEDKIMAAALVPLVIRMAFIHLVLRYGTNNVDPTGLSESEIYLRSVGSRLVIAARIFYTLFIWIAKFTVSEFLKRLTERFWRRGYELVLRGIRIFLVVTFFVVVIATLSECQPFTHFWQVSPDPGPKCRQGYAHLLSMGAADIVTDILLIIFPIPIILSSAMSWRKKLDLVALFSMSFLLIGITAARIPSVIDQKGSQQYRTVFASGEILAATAVSNAVILGSFLRDRGVKKIKYKYGSATDSMDRPSIRRPTVATQQWGSDEDLIRGVGMRLGPDLLEDSAVPRPAPVALPAASGPNGMIDPNWQFPSKVSESYRDSASDLKIPIPEDPFPSPRDLKRTSSRRNVSFFDVGGLLEDGPDQSGSARNPGATSTQDFASNRRGSRALLSDLGGLLTQSRTHNSLSPTARRPSRHVLAEDVIELSPHSSLKGAGALPPTGVMGPILARQENRQSLQDVGGLLESQQLAVPRIQSPSQRGSSSSGTTVPPSPQSPQPRPAAAPQRPPILPREKSLSLNDVGGLLRS